MTSRLMYNRGAIITASRCGIIACGGWRRRRLGTALRLSPATPRHTRRRLPRHLYAARTANAYCARRRGGWQTPHHIIKASMRHRALSCERALDKGA